MPNLYDAHRQWSERPDDERFDSLPALIDAAAGYRRASAEKTTRFEDMHVTVSSSGDLRVYNRYKNVDKAAAFTHFAFGQFASRVGAPASYLRKLPPQLAADNLNYSIQAAPDTHGDVKMLGYLHRGGGPDPLLYTRSVTSEIYERIWNEEVARFCTALPPGWRVPPARPVREDQPGARRATADDLIHGGTHGLSVHVGDWIAPAGLYASDHDLFIFLVNEERTVRASTGQPLFRGVFLKNSEVGAASLSFTCFLYDSVCGNHIVWSAVDKREIRIRHVGKDARRKMDASFYALALNVERTSAQEEEEKLRRAGEYCLGKTRKEVAERVSKHTGISVVNAEKAYDIADSHVDVHGSPATAWGMVSGLTRLSQETPYADTRNQIDRSAALVLELAF